MLRQLVLSIDDAKIIAAAARAEAERNSWNVVIAIVDDGGHLMYLVVREKLISKINPRTAGL